LISGLQIILNDFWVNFQKKIDTLVRKKNPQALLTKKDTLNPE